MTPSRLEKTALALAANPHALRARLEAAASCLRADLRPLMRRARFDAVARTLTGDGLRLRWQTREYPDWPESADNQQTSIGFVIVERIHTRGE